MIRRTRSPHRHPASAGHRKINQYRTEKAKIKNDLNRLEARGHDLSQKS
jgi:hypothetical protein